MIGGTDVIDPLAALYAIGLAAVHLFAGRLRFLDVVPRSRWLSFSGGVAVAYVFVHVLPELQRASRTIARSDSGLVQLENYVYLVSLVGFTVFYGLERYVRRSKTGGPARDGEPIGVFWIHAGSFIVYNVLIGYLLLHRVDQGVVSLSTFFIAMALHLFVNDYGLRAHHGRDYRRFGRWLLAGAVIIGLLLGSVITFDELVLAVLFAFLAGGVILNVIKEELPSERQSRFWAFALGVLVYSFILLLV